MKKLVAVMIMIPFLSGCYVFLAGGAGAAGAFAWAKGTLSRNYKQPFETTWEGTIFAVRNLKFKITENRRDLHYGIIKAKMPSTGDTVKIALERWTSRETKVSVRVGTIGKKRVSEHIHEEIAKALR